VTEPNWAGGWRPADYRPPRQPRPTSSWYQAASSQRSAAARRGRRRSTPAERRRRAALDVLRLALDGLAKVLVLLMRLSFQLISASLRLLLPAIGAQGAIKRVGRL
jgi:hypothetical protein